MCCWCGFWDQSCCTLRLLLRLVGVSLGVLVDRGRHVLAKPGVRQHAKPVGSMLGVFDVC